MDLIYWAQGKSYESAAWHRRGQAGGWHCAWGGICSVRESPSQHLFWQICCQERGLGAAWILSPERHNSVLLLLKLHVNIELSAQPQYRLNYLYLKSFYFLLFIIILEQLTVQWVQHCFSWSLAHFHFLKWFTLFPLPQPGSLVRFGPRDIWIQKLDSLPVELRTQVCYKQVSQPLKSNKDPCWVHVAYTIRQGLVLQTHWVFLTPLEVSGDEVEGTWTLTGAILSFTGLDRGPINSWGKGV